MFKNFPGGMPPDPQTEHAEVVYTYTICNLGQHCQTPTINSAAMYDNIYDMSVKESTSQQH